MTKTITIPHLKLLLSEIVKHKKAGLEEVRREKLEKKEWAAVALISGQMEAFEAVLLAIRGDDTQLMLHYPESLS